MLPGTRLVREWGGRIHTVEVVTAPSGTGTAFVHGGHIYGSLSQVARAITGARWSGPRFFGLVRRRSVRAEHVDATAALAATVPTEAVAP